MTSVCTLICRSGAFLLALVGAGLAHPPLAAAMQLPDGPATPVIVWNPAELNLAAPDPLAVLNAMADVPGAFEYTPLPTRLGPGNICVTFTPEDRVAYSMAHTCRLVSVLLETTTPAPVRVGAVAHPSFFKRLLADPARRRLFAITEAYDPVLRLLAIDAATKQVTREITLAANGIVGLPSSMALDATTGRLFVKDGLLPIVWTVPADPYGATTFQWFVPQAMASTVALAGQNSHTPIAFDTTTRRLYVGGQVVSPEPASVLFVLNPDDPNAANVGVIVLPESCPFGPDELAIDAVMRVAYITRGECNVVQALDLRVASPTFQSVLGRVPLPAATLAPSVVSSRSTMVVERGRLYLGGVDPLSVWLQVYDADPASASFNTPLAFSRLPDTYWIHGAGGVTGMALNADAGMLYVVSGDPDGSDRGGFAYLLAVDARTGALVSGRTLRTAALTNPAVYLPQSDEIALGIGGAEDLGWLAGVHFFREIWPSETVATGTSATPVVVTTASVSLTFDAVHAAGQTTVERMAPVDVPAQLPPHFEVAGEAFEISSTASFSGQIKLCFNLSSVTDPDIFSTLRVLHGESGVLVDRTSSHDFATGTVCATVTSLSPFVIARVTKPQYGVVQLYDSGRAVKAGGTLPVRLKIVDAAGVNQSSAALTVRATGIRRLSSDVDREAAATGHANIGQIFRFDPDLGGGGYIFNLKTTGLLPGSYELTFQVGGGSASSAVAFQVR